MDEIDRTPLREQVYRKILERIVTGELAPGSRVKDSVAAERFGISRTPVRETLLRLEQEGFLENPTGRGFSVRPLELREVNDVYPVVWALECLALNTYAPISRSALADLNSLNAWMVNSADDPIRRIELDNVWHQKLIADCGNVRLVRMVSSLKSVIRRYEYSYMQEAPLLSELVSDHERIVERLQQDDRPGAAAQLEEHWRRSLEAMTEKLER